MRKENRPLFYLRLCRWLNQFYIKHKIRPQFDALGKEAVIAKPCSLQIFGKHISAGDYLHIVSSKQKPVSFTTWSSKQQQGHIAIGSFCLFAPGVSLNSAVSIRIDDACMLAADVIVSDSDWHGVYNRTRPFRCSQAVHLKRNSWIGLRAIIGKGVTVGENSIVAAGSVVVEDVPDNCIVGGNPAKPIKWLNPERRMLTREFLFSKGSDYWKNQEEVEAFLFADNSISNWLRASLRPNRSD